MLIGDFFVILFTLSHADSLWKISIMLKPLPKSSIAFTLIHWQGFALNRWNQFYSVFYIVLCEEFLFRFLWKDKHFTFHQYCHTQICSHNNKRYMMLLADKERSLHELLDKVIKESKKELSIVRGQKLWSLARGSV